MSDLVKDIRSVAQCIYLACNSDIASDVAIKCKAIADSHEKITQQNKMLQDALVEIKRIAECHPIDKVIHAEAEKALGKIK